MECQVAPIGFSPPVLPDAPPRRGLALGACSADSMAAMYRNDRDALAEQVEQLRRERENLLAENDAMRTDLLARRQDGSPFHGRGNVYKQGIGHLTPGERAALTRHQMTPFPTWALVMLHFVTFGLFPLIHLSALHGKLPQAESDDPTAGKAIGFSFIPYFHLYWWVFNALRLADRINLQFRLRGLPEPVPRGLAVTAGVVGVIPYINIVFGYLFVWPVALIYFQLAANRLAALPQLGADASIMAGVAVPHLRVQQDLRVPQMPDAPAPHEALQADVEAEQARKARYGLR